MKPDTAPFGLFGSFFALDLFEPLDTLFVDYKRGRIREAVCRQLHMSERKKNKHFQESVTLYAQGVSVLGPRVM